MSTPKHGSFSEIDFLELCKVMKKVKDTFSDNDPLPISELKNSNNFDLVENIYLEIVNLSTATSVFPQSEKVASIKQLYKGKGDQEDTRETTLNLKCMLTIPNFISVTDTQNIVNKVEQIMANIRIWMNLYKLKLNEQKTESLLFRTKENLKKLEIYRN